MMRRLAASALVMLSGCLLYFDGDNPPDKCQVPVQEPAYYPAPLRDPGDLTCDSFGGGYCDPDCGPCPATGVKGTADLAPIPSWGICGHSCESLAEGACAMRSDCRVVKDAYCATAGECFTDFMGCFPTDTYVNTSAACAGADAWTCSQNPDCVAFHRSDMPCPADLPAEQCPRPFAYCLPQGASPGSCYAQAVCRSLPPSCPTGTRPGVINGCWSGACIPTDLCEPPPPPA